MTEGKTAVSAVNPIGGIPRPGRISIRRGGLGLSGKGTTAATVVGGKFMSNMATGVVGTAARK